MLKVHFVANTRAGRVIWLLEELGLEYEVNIMPFTKEGLKSEEHRARHALGRVPVLEDGDISIFESGAIIDYLLRQHGNGQFRPTLGTWHHEQYLQWLHYGESGAVLPLMLKLYTSKLADSGAALQPRISDELERHLGYIEQSLEGVEWLVGNTLSGADIQLSFVAEIAPLLHTADKLPNLLAFRDRCQNRPAYRRALSKTEPYAYGPK